MDNNFNDQFNKDTDNNPTEKAGYYTTQQKQEILMFPIGEEKKPKSKLGLGILIGILIMAFAVFLGSFVFGLFGTLKRNTKTELNYQEKLDLLNDYFDAYYMGDINSDEYEDAVARGALHGIGDKYAEYYSAEEFSEFMDSISGNYAGIGVSIAPNDEGQIEIYKVFEGAPAEEAGLLIGDIIIEANGVKDFETPDDVVAVVRGEPGSTVDIKVKRKEEEISFTLERRNIEVPSVEYKMLEDDLGYIEISNFDIATVNQFNGALDALEADGMKGVILDLRDNPGGDYSTVVAMADRVLPEGVIISTKDKDGNVKSENSDEAHKLTIPCVVIVNENSASASELFAGAIQDYGIATIVGTVTYGKGVVQSIYSLPDGSGMKFTTEAYYTPKGRDIDGVGITPDVIVELPEDVFEDGIIDEAEDVQLQKAIEILKEDV